MADVFWGMTEQEIRKRVVEEAAKLVGIREGTAEHKKLIDTYNTRLPKLPRGYRLTYSDPWCAATMTYIGIVLQISHIILPECSCSRMIELYKAQGRWMERDDYVPDLADIVMYDWDAKKGECTGAPEHTGMIIGKQGRTLRVLEGNYDNMVKIREIPIEYVRVRGYCLPDYGKLVHGYQDVPADAWYREAVQWADGKGITEGVGEHEFAPKLACTRSHVVTMLWRSHGSPEAKQECPFPDVEAGSWYAEAVAWAAEKGITEGIAEWVFDPYGFCTRGQIVTMLWRAAGRPMAENGDHPFADVDGGSFYSDAVEWAWCKGITIGCAEREFMPFGVCTRAQLVEMLYRLYKVA